MGRKPNTNMKVEKAMGEAELKTITGVESPSRQLVDKVLPWLIKSGAALTSANAVSTALLSLQNGQIDSKTFLTGLAYTVLFMITNATIYYISKTNENNQSS